MKSDQSNNLSKDQIVTKVGEILQSLQLGSTKEDVLRLLGDPYRIEDMATSRYMYLYTSNGKREGIGTVNGLVEAYYYQVGNSYILMEQTESGLRLIGWRCGYGCSYGIKSRILGVL